MFWMDWDFGEFTLILGVFFCIYRLLQQERIHLGVWTRKPPKCARRSCSHHWMDYAS